MSKKLNVYYENGKEFKYDNIDTFQIDQYEGKILLKILFKNGKTKKIDFKDINVIYG